MKFDHTASLKNTYPLHRDVRKRRLCRIRDPATPTWKYSQTPPAAGDDGFNGLICLGNLHENIRTRFGFENRMAKKCGVSQQKVANVLFMPFWIWTAKLCKKPKRGLLLSRWRTVWCLFQYVSVKRHFCGQNWGGACWTAKQFSAQNWWSFTGRLMLELAKKWVARLTIIPRPKSCSSLACW